MKTCEAYQTNISALIDGELRGAELTETIRHLAGCKTCMAQFESFQWLQEQIETELNSPASPREMWDEIVAETTPKRRTTFIRFRPTIYKAIAAAAVLAVSFLLGYGSRNVIIPYMEKNKPIVLASRTGEMNDAQFLSLTRELLTADPIYQQKMYQILRTLGETAWESNIEPLEQANYQQDGDTFKF